jgi:prevent-host-death family protein
MAGSNAGLFLFVKPATAIHICDYRKYDLNYGQKGATRMNVSMAEAKAKLAELVKLVENGEEVKLTRHGKPVARIVPLENEGELPRIGALEGQIWIADDFDELGPEWDEYVK